MEEHTDAVVATAVKRTAPASPSRIRQERGVVRPAPRRDLQIGSMPRTNVLVAGNPEATRIVVDMLRLDLRGPVVRWRAGQPLELPTPGQAATLVLDNLTRLTADQQLHVLGWLEQVMGRVRVVSTSGIPVWPLVQTGHFNEDLLSSQHGLRRYGNLLTRVRARATARPRRSLGVGGRSFAWGFHFSAHRSLMRGCVSPAWPFPCWLPP